MKNIFENEKALFIPTYSRLPISVLKGEGCYLYDKNGEKYLDFFSGLAVNALGYAHPKIIKAVNDQITKFAHLSNIYIADSQIEFAELLLKKSKMSKIFLTNSGAETIETALKLLRLKLGPEKIIYSLTNSFHGRTYGALTLTGRDKYKVGFEPLLNKIDNIEFNNVADLEAKVNGQAGAIFVEFIQGEGGINEVSEEFAFKLKELQKNKNLIIVADAIQDGIGRSGKGFAHEYFDIKPDLLCCAKAIGGGFPLGALLASDDLSNVFTIGKHGTTYGGNPVCCAAGKAVLEEVFENGLIENIKKRSAQLMLELNNIRQKYPHIIKRIKGKGLMLGIELEFKGDDFVNKMREKKVLINCANEYVLRLLPPYIIGESEVEIFITEFENILKEYSK